MGQDTARPNPIRADRGAGLWAEASSDWSGTAARQETDDRFGDTDLSCPSCGVMLLGAEAFEVFRVCSHCQRHFPLPARDRLRLLVDRDSFVETNAALVSVDPLVFRDLLPIPDRLEEVRSQVAAMPSPGGGIGEAIITGTVAVDDRPAVFIVLDHAYLGGSLGPVAGEKVLLGMELAANRGLPLIALCAAGGARTETGLLSLVQLPKMAAAAARLRRAGVPFISVLAHPTTGGVYAGLANQADIVLAEPGAHIGLGVGSGTLNGAVAEPGAGANTSEFLLGQGLIDAIVERSRLRATLASLLGLMTERRVFYPGTAVPAPLASPTTEPVWEAMQLARRSDRPTARDYVRRLLTEFVELHGDRVTGDDPAIVAGLGRLRGVPLVVVGQERPREEANNAAGDGRVGAAGYRKAVRAMRLAGHLELPILTFVDTVGATVGAQAEASGIGVAVGQALGLTSLLPVPIVSVVIGEGGGVGALALTIGDRVLMQEHAVYSVEGPDVPGPPSVIGPETGGRPTDRAGSTPRLTARECQRLGLVDVVVPEPDSGAHAHPDQASDLLGAALTQAFSELSRVGSRRLRDDRSRRIRSLGQTTAEGRDAARREVRELQDLHRTVARSLGDLRERWEGRYRGRPRLHLPPLHRPDLVDLAGRVAARRLAILEAAESRQRGGRPSNDRGTDE